MENELEILEWIEEMKKKIEKELLEIEMLKKDICYGK